MKSATSPQWPIKLGKERVVHSAIDQGVSLFKLGLAARGQAEDYAVTDLVWPGSGVIKHFNFGHKGQGHCRALVAILNNAQL